jgi:hypothetical protein
LYFSLNGLSRELDWAFDDINRKCAAKAFYSCPAIISRRPESQKIPKEPQLNPEEESKIIQARSHVTLEKSSRNYKPSEE